MEILKQFGLYLNGTQGFSENTCAAYSAAVHSLYFWFEESSDRLLTASPKDIDNAKQHFLLIGRSAATINLYIAAWSCFYKYAVKHLGISQDPTALVTPLRVPSRLPKILPLAKVSTFLFNVEPRTYKQHRGIVAALLLLYTGVRAAEAVNITWNDIYLPQLHSLRLGRLRVIGKGNKERIIPFGPYLIEQLTIFREYGTTGYLLQGVNGEQLSTANLRQVLFAALKNIVEETCIHPHIFRHTYASVLAASGMPIDEIARRLGHTNISTTQRYINSLLQIPFEQ